MTAAHGHPDQITGIAEGWWICLPDCRNEPNRDGFYACDPQGRLVDPVAGAWDGITYVCEKCGRIIDQRTGVVIGLRDPDLVTEIATCGNCGDYIELRGVWQHVTDTQVTLRCQGTHRRAVPAPADTASPLPRVIEVDLRIVEATAITLYADGITASGPNGCLLFVGGEFTPTGVATWLHIPVESVDDRRDERALS